MPLNKETDHDILVYKNIWKKSYTEQIYIIDIAYTHMRYILIKLPWQENPANTYMQYTEH